MPRDLIESHAWIAPNGAWYPCGHGEHDATAARLMPNGGIIALEQRGWLRLHGDGHIAMAETRRPTRAQRDTLADIAAVTTGEFRRGVLLALAEDADGD